MSSTMGKGEGKGKKLDKLLQTAVGERESNDWESQEMLSTCAL